jgi:hypothetical protein
MPRSACSVALNTKSAVIASASACTQMN